MVDGPLFRLGSVGVYPYGICLALGIIACFAFLLFTMTMCNFNEEAIDKILLIGIFATGFGIFMAMVFQALYNYIASPSSGFHLGEAMTFQGGLIGGVVGFLGVWNLYVFVIAPRAKNKVLQNHMNASLSDALPFIPPAITIAHAFGRLGCTFAGCCHGAETNAWYGIWMYTNEFGHAKVVPTQLFECFFLVALTAVMLVLFFKFKFKFNFSVYAISYGIWRFIIEFFRDDYRGGAAGALLSPSQIISLIMIPLGIGYVFLQLFVLSKFMKHPELQASVRKPKQDQLAVAGVAGDVQAENQGEASVDSVAEAPAEPESQPKEQPTAQPQNGTNGEDKGEE